MNKRLLNIFTILVFTSSVYINAEYRLGVDYRMVDNPLPVKKDGVVEVVETFWYGCNACYQFDPVVNKWASNQGDDIKFTKMPVTWSKIHQEHAKLYYAVEALKLNPSTHSAVFVTMHKEGNFLQNTRAIQEFLERFGVAQEVSLKYLNSFTVKQQVSRASKQARQLRVSSTPMMIVDGKYIIESRGSYEKIMKVVDHVVELQRPNS